MGDLNSGNATRTAVIEALRRCLGARLSTPQDVPDLHALAVPHHPRQPPDALAYTKPTALVARDAAGCAPHGELITEFGAQIHAQEAPAFPCVARAFEKQRDFMPRAQTPGMVKGAKRRNRGMGFREPHAGAEQATHQGIPAP